LCLAYSRAWWWGSIIVWGCMSAGDTWELSFNEGNMDSNIYCDILKQNMIPFRNCAGQHYNDPKHTTKMTTVLLKKLKVNGVAKYVSRPETY